MKTLFLAVTEHLQNIEKLFIKSKIQFIESKSQLVCPYNGCQPCCLSSQRYNLLKANHNEQSFVVTCTGLFIKSKIQFIESKSQHIVVSH